MKFLAIVLAAFMAATAVSGIGQRAEAGPTPTVHVGDPVTNVPCLSETDKGTMRQNAAKLALDKAWATYAKQNGADESVRYEPAVMAAYVPSAVRAYRTFLIVVGHRVILARGQGCIRDVVALVDGTTHFSLYTEEELLAQYMDAATDETVAGFQGTYDGTVSGYEAAAIAFGVIGMAGTILQTTTPTVTSLIMQVLGYTLSAASVVGQAIEHGIMDAGGFGSGGSAGDRER